MGDLTVGDYANGVPNIRLGEILKSFMRQLIWIIPLGIIGFLVAGYLTKDFKRTYSGDGRIMVQLGDEYVYNPVGQAANGQGLTTTIDTITLTEAALMKNDTIIAQVIGEMTPTRAAQDRFNKDKFDDIRNAPNPRQRGEAIMELRQEVAKSYIVSPQAKSSIIDVSFTHENPDVAVETTNAFIDAYVNSRKGVFVGGEAVADRREATENQLLANERAIARFLNRNNISDFESEQKGLRERTEELKASLNTTRASMAETEAALAKVEDQLRATPETIDLYRDDRASQRVAQAELELRQLMAKYLPTSDPVRQKQTELAELRSLQSSYGGKAAGGRRVGPNPVQQALLTRRNTLAATANSLREREFTLQRQLNSADTKIRRLTALTPEYQNLLRERETVNVRLTSYNAKEQESLVDAQQAEAKSENVRVISRAEFANKGRNMRKLMWALGTLGWGVLLFFVAMIRVFLDPRLYAVPNAIRQRPAEDVVEMEDSPIYDPIPEAVPAHVPDIPPAPNPFVAPAVAEVPYAEPAYAAPVSTGYANPYTAQGEYVDYGSSAGAYAGPGADTPSYGSPEYGTTAYADGYGQGAPAQPTGFEAGYADVDQSAFAGNAALDLSHNPYATGQVRAGALEEDGYPVPPPYNQ